MGSTTYLVSALIINYYDLCGYQAVKRITIADSCVFFPKLVLSLSISYFLYKSTVNQFKKKDPVLGEEVDLIRYIQGAKVRDFIYSEIDNDSLW